MNVVSELSNEIANAIFINRKTRKNLDTPEAVAVVRRFHNALKTLRKAEREALDSLPIAPNSEEKAAVGSH